jgi:hypothetical protein
VLELYKKFLILLNNSLSLLVLFIRFWKKNGYSVFKRTVKLGLKEEDKVT